ncbi:MAG: glycosyltransferase family 2 protein [Candidatus Levybacteria bacterium]|nr:glycosyltransferase family 2 protein [Candidatus Levybacteria bacterium]
MNKISAVVSAYNEEKNIERCLKSLSFADEIIVVDNESIDQTSEISLKYTKKVFKQKNNPSEIDIQKNFGFEKASNEWILSIDADETVTSQLAQEIKRILSAKPSTISQINGFWIPRKNLIFGKWIEHTGWYPDLQLRLFRKGKAKYTKRHIHEDITLEGTSANLSQHLIHHHYQTISEFLEKTFVYAKNEADNYLDKGYQFSYFDAIKLPLSEFLSRFFARKGYKDQFHGLILSLLMAFYHFLVFCYIWEKKDFVKYEKQDFMEQTERQFKDAGKEIVYWVTKQKLENIKNPFKKVAVKIKSKITN